MGRPITTGLRLPECSPLLVMHQDTQGDRILVIRDPRGLLAHTPIRLRLMDIPRHQQVSFLEKPHTRTEIPTFTYFSPCRLSIQLNATCVYTKCGPTHNVCPAFKYRYSSLIYSRS